ncbi:hypothetical protein F2Q68_00032477 [Brassica cretica]|uniref:Uncharacterized protein n=1 Tax=Brassica cretica TaxID=69181 RepID=A0A8S9GB94_BRACR|nr:hypothetical protein F2Q68_00032477 [Brassica cretica]
MTTSPSCFAAESLTTPSLCLCRLSISKIKPERVVDPSLNLLGLLHPSDVILQPAYLVHVFPVICFYPSFKLVSLQLLDTRLPSAVLAVLDVLLGDPLEAPPLLRQTHDPVSVQLLVEILVSLITLYRSDCLRRSLMFLIRCFRAFE